MTAYLVLVGLILVLGLLVWIFARSLKAARQRVREAESKAEAANVAYVAAMKELHAREEDRHALENKLAALSTGTPDARLAASLDGLRELAAHTSGGSGSDPGIVAHSPAPARDGN